MRFEGKVAIVTAAAGAGIGQAAARRLASEGANVVVSDIHERRTKEVCDDITQKTGRETLGIICDVRHREQVDNMVRQALEKWGKVDILINNAGINRLSPVVNMDDDTWNLVIWTNLYGTFFCSRAVLPSMIKQKWGRIINLSSIAQWEGSPMGESHYCAAKAAISAFTRCLAREVAKEGITVNAIAPGVAWNPFLARIYPEEATKEWLQRMPMGRFGTPEEIASVIAFLCSDEASYITGEVVTVAGGLYFHA
jgi:3-oxoacyl-[acyl-carrier protein] reductase